MKPSKLQKKKLSIADSVSIIEQTEVDITIKGDKIKFPNKIPCRLINPSKSGICNSRGNSRENQPKSKFNFIIFSNVITRYPTKSNIHSYNLTLRIFIHR